ncbi:MAG: ATP-binding cassette domain-containing protein [Arenicellales bacterium]|nr:ATP-binding cassette domain-containing protein [Pseudomonadales bacterium]MDP6413112.1 ATP-binding cassette domain-containing protein [Arenicellales bacterium]
MKAFSASVDSAPAIQIQADPIIMCKGLRKVYGDLEAVSGLDLDIPRGNCFGLLGPNGAGKTTTLRMLLGQSPRTSGALSVFGESIESNLREIRQRTGIVPQANNLDPDFTVSENLRIYGLYFRITSSVLEHRIPKLLKLVELDHRAKDRISTLSGGMKRRLILARALINDPDLLLFDEPTTGLDPQARHMIWSQIHRLKRNGKTILLTTHYMEEAERLCDEIVIIDHGKLITQGPPKDLIRIHCQKEVLEIRGELPDRLFTELGYQRSRFEQAGDTYYLYSDDPTELLETAAALPELACLHRQSGLEDVFLRLTGRELRH